MTTDTTAAAPAVPIPRTDPDQVARTLLAAYPHVANCSPCLGYTLDHLTELPPLGLLIAVLAHHDSSHRYDVIHGPGQHFTPCT
jgi:hypothetical protein